MMDPVSLRRHLQELWRHSWAQRPQWKESMLLALLLTPVLPRDGTDTV